MTESGGHVFVVHGDLTALACHEVVVPVDLSLNATPIWNSLTGCTDQQGPWSRVPDIEIPTGWGRDVHVVHHVGAPTRRQRVWLMDAAITGDGEPERLLDSIEATMRTVAAADSPDVPPRRSRRLVGIPLPGVGAGGYGSRVGEVISAVLDRLQLGADLGLDVALVLKQRAHFAAVQHQRRTLVQTAPDAIVVELAEHIRHHRLAVFLGAGVSMAAGLPSWDELLTLLERDNKLTTDLGAPFEERAEAIERAAGEPGLTRQVAAILNAHGRYALAHGLVAGWEVPEVVTTNYDTNYEDAVAATDRAIAVLPRERAGDGSTSWILKVHGDTRDPARGLVLTRSSYEQFDASRGPLGAIFQSLLMLRHVLFVGYGMGDGNLLALAEGARAMLAPHLDNAHSAGTVLHLRSSPVDTSALGGLLTAVPVGSGRDDLAAARDLEILLDRVSLQATEDASFLLDDRFGVLLTDPADRALKGELLRLAGSGLHQQSPYWPQIGRRLADFGG